MQEEASSVAASRHDQTRSIDKSNSKPLVWQNMQHLMDCMAHQQQHPQQFEVAQKPQERWGHSSVCAYNRKLFIIGGYQGKSTSHLQQQHQLDQQNIMAAAARRPFLGSSDQVVQSVAALIGQDDDVTGDDGTEVSDGADWSEGQQSSFEQQAMAYLGQHLINNNAPSVASSSAFDSHAGEEGELGASLMSSSSDAQSGTVAGGGATIGQGVRRCDRDEGNGRQVGKSQSSIADTTAQGDQIMRTVDQIDQETPANSTNIRAQGALDGLSHYQSSSGEPSRENMRIANSELEEERNQTSLNSGAVELLESIGTDELQRAMESPMIGTFSPRQQVHNTQNTALNQRLSVPPPVPIFLQNPYQLTNQRYEQANLHQIVSEHPNPVLNSNVREQPQQHTSLESNSTSQVDTNSPVSATGPLQSSTTSSFQQSPIQQHLLPYVQQQNPYPNQSQQSFFQQINPLIQQSMLQQPGGLNHNFNNLQQQQSATSVLSNNIGQYLGDVWEFDFGRCAYTKHKTVGDDSNLLERSNHTAVFYEKHNAIYIFGGGQAQRVRYNDTLKLTLPPDTDSQTTAPSMPVRKTTEVKKMIISEGSLVPSPRTYHASCLLENFMLVSGGEANNTDLNDMWALNLDTCFWFKVETLTHQHSDQFISKRFHTISTMQGQRVISFGGCHSEYVHLNDVNVFDFKAFIESDGQNTQVNCIKLDFRTNTFGQVPSTRWGHAAAVHGNKLFILGGRNNDDINDLHSFDLDQKRWSQIEIGHPMPKARRRHSAVFVSSTIAMFGGFDGEFFNDMHLLHFDQEQLSRTQASKDAESQASSSLLSDYAKLIDSQEHSNIKFMLDPTTPGALDQIIHANKSLVLFRLFEREVREYCQDSRVFQNRMEDVLTCPQTRQMCPQFFQRVFDAKQGQTLRLPGITTRHEFLLFLEFCYCDRLVSPVTGAQITTLRHICQTLGLATLTQYFDALAQHVRNKLQSELMRDFEAKLMQQLGSSSLMDQGSPPPPLSNLTVEQRIELEKSVHDLFFTVKFHFNQLDNSAVVQSPEDRIEKQNHLVQAEMVKCRNLDHFFDVVFELDCNHLMRANSAVLHARCEYFKIMFDSKYGFQESSRRELTLTPEVKHSNIRNVRVRGIPKQYFTAIIQFLYTGSFCQTECNLAYYLRLMIYADYFMIAKLSEVCQDILRQFVKPRNVLDLFLVAHAHNAAKLEIQCINFLAINFSEIQKSTQWKDFQKKCQYYGRKCLFNKLKEDIDSEMSRNFVSISIQRQVQSMAKADWPRYEFGQVALQDGVTSTTPNSSRFLDESQPVENSEEKTMSPTQSMTVTSTRNGITLVTSNTVNVQPPVCHLLGKGLGSQNQKKKSPSNRRDQQLPAIVKVATGVTQRISDSTLAPSSITKSGEPDFDQLMSTSSYIYFEEHYPTESYPKIELASSCDGSRKRPFSIHEIFEQEEVKNEGFDRSAIKKPLPNSFLGNIFQKLFTPSQDAACEDGENLDPNQNSQDMQSTMMIQTGFRPHKQVQQQKSQSALHSHGKNSSQLINTTDQQQSQTSRQKNNGGSNNLFWRF